MSFFASNDRIRITNDAGKTIFDTNNPMPHIIGRISDAQITVTFPDVATTYWRTELNHGPNTTCAYIEHQYQCHWENQCGFEQVCGWVIVEGVPQYRCEPQWVCKDVQVCGWEPVWVNGDLWYIAQGFSYAATEWSNVYDLGAVPGDVDADFILANCYAERLSGGTIPGDFGVLGQIPCGIPLNAWFVVNGSAIVETASNVSNGIPWLTRLMSIYVEGGRLKVSVQHSSSTIQSLTEWADFACTGGSFPPFPTYVGGIPNPPPTKSSQYRFTFDVLLGKFTV